MDVWDAIREKRAVRRFTDAPLPDAVARRILDAGRRAQSAKNSQPWDFVVVRDRERLRALSQCGAWLGHVAGARLTAASAPSAPPHRRGDAPPCRVRPAARRDRGSQTR